MNFEKKIEKMKSAESEMKNTYDNIVNSATLLLDTMETTSYEEETSISVHIEDDSEVDESDISFSIDTECENSLIYDEDDDILMND